MNESQKENTVSAHAAAKGCTNLLSTLGDVGVTWAAYGLKVGKMALETSAETLGRTAKALETLARSCRRRRRRRRPRRRPRAWRARRSWRSRRSRRRARRSRTHRLPEE